jgi:fibronectin type 3 domain-containing protein
MGLDRLPLRACAGLAALAAVLATPHARAAVAATRESGTLVVLHGDDLATRSVGYGYALETRHGRIALRPRRPIAQALAGATVQVRGTLSGGGLVTGGGSEIMLEQAPGQHLALGSQRVAVILFNFQGQDPSAQPFSLSDAQGVVFTGASSVRAYYDDESWGKLSLTGDVFGWYTIPGTSGGCSTADAESWADAALSQAKAHGFDLSAYGHVVFGMPFQSSCAWAGLGEVNGTRTWTNGPSGFTLRVIAHELGHNFGLRHANSYRCSDAAGRPVVVSGSCTSTEYGDPYDQMGGSPDGVHQLDVWHKGQVGWLADGRVQTVLASGTYRVAPVSSPSGVIGLQVPRPDGRSFWLEARQPTALDEYTPTSPALGGVLVHLNGGWSSDLGQSQLLDATPGTPTFDDAPLPAGQSFTDPTTGITITAVDVSPLGATIAVALAGSGDVSAPTVPTGLAATARFGTHVHLEWNASSDDTGVVSYRVRRDGGLVATVPGTAYDDFTTAVATAYAYTVTAVDGAGRESAASAPATLTTPSASDVTPPSVPAGLAAVATDGPRLTLTWQPSADDDAVAGYRVYRDGALVATVAAPLYADTSVVAGRRYAYAVSAVDHAGNASARSAAVSASYRGGAADGAAPTVPGGVRALIAGRSVKVTWRPSSDAGGISAYRLYRNGELVATVRATRWTDLQYPDFAAFGKVRYAVAAVDASGNASAPSRAVVATRPPRLRLTLVRVRLQRLSHGRRLELVARVRPATHPAAACAVRTGRGRWHRCGFDGSGAVHVSLALASRRGAVVVALRARPAIGVAVTASRRVR